MLEAIGAGSRKRIGGDWGEKWRNSPELKDVKETVRTLNEDALAHSGDVGYLLYCRKPAYMRRKARPRVPSTLHLPGSNSRLSCNEVSGIVRD